MNIKIKLVLILTVTLTSVCYSQYDIKKTEYDESKIRKHLNTNEIDPIEGIYKYVSSNGNSQYRLGIIKSDFLYLAIIL